MGIVFFKREWYYDGGVWDNVYLKMILYFIIFFSMVLLLRRICLMDEFFNIWFDVFISYFIKRGYKYCFIKDEIDKVC